MKRTSLLFAIAMVVMSFGTAKAQRTATINVAEILNTMPEKKKADEQLEAFSKTKEAELEKQAQAFQAEVDAYQKEAGRLSEQQRAAKEQDLQKKQQNLQQLYQVAQQDLAKRQNDAYAPIEFKVNNAVEKVAKANGYDFIFDANTVGLIYRGGADATAAVKKELGL